MKLKLAAALAIGFSCRYDSKKESITRRMDHRQSSFSSEDYSVDGNVDKSSLPFIGDVLNGHADQLISDTEAIQSSCRNHSSQLNLVGMADNSQTVGSDKYIRSSRAILPSEDCGLARS